MDFYDEVLRELLVAIGAAMVVGNLMALIRRRAPTPVSESQDGEAPPQAPLARTVTFLVIGFVIAVWGLASLLSS